MNKRLFISKIILGVFVALLIIVPFVGQHCGNMSISKSASMCHMHVLQQSKINIEKINQLMLAIVGNQNYLFLSFLVIVFLSIPLVLLANQFGNKINLTVTTDHMKPWDSLRFALAQGLIHSKHFN